ncbi:solute carrier family 35 member G1-like [Ptychodera flava]|uniref:solute carrier family 35 member G1-like n=1 Tax=Ptychodera flava TaxID=63121 RepID=UPI00396A1795
MAVEEFEMTSHSASDLQYLFASEDEQKRKGNPRFKCLSCKILRSMVGVSLAVFHGAGYAIVSGLVAIATDYGVSEFQVIFFEGIVLAVVTIIPIVYYRMDVLETDNKTQILLLLNAIPGLATKMLHFYSLSRAPVGNINAIFSGSNPIITPLLACCFLREKWKVADAVSTLLNVIGIILITGPTFIFGSQPGHAEAQAEVIAYIAAIAGAFFYSLTIVMGRIVGARSQLSVILLYRAVFAFIIAYICLLIKGLPLLLYSKESLAIVVAESIVNALTIGAIYRSLQLESAATVAILINIQVVCSYILDFAFLHNQVKPYELVGAALVLSSALLVFIFHTYTNYKIQKALNGNNNST